MQIEPFDRPAWSLDRERPIAVLPRGVRMLVCRAGTIWITQQGRPDDVVLRAGEVFRPYGRGRLVVETLTESACVQALAERRLRFSRAPTGPAPGRGPSSA